MLFVAGGDGRVKALRGFDMQWDVLAQDLMSLGLKGL